MHISFWKHHPISDQKGEILAAETIAFYQTFKPDFLKITPAGTWIATCYGLNDYYDGDSLGRRFVSQPLIQTTEDWNKIQPFDDIPAPLVEQLKAAEIVCKELKEVPVFATIFSPVNQAIQLCGRDTFLKHLAENPTLVEEKLHVLSLNTQQIIKKYVELGIEGIYYATQSCQPKQLTKDIYDKFGKSIDESCLEFASNLVQSVIFHLHGESIYLHIKENIPFLTIHYEESSSNKIQSNYPLVVGIPAQIIDSTNDEDSIKHIISAYSNSTELILCGCVLPLSSSAKTIETWINVVHKM